jgi:DNA-binding response OmpR family regulator
MNARSFTILIVSPDRVSLRRLSKFLDVFGYDVRQATDAEKALAAAEAARPDFLVVDGSSGQPADLQLCRSIRRAAPQGYTYSLLLLERPEVGDVTSALEAGFDDFLAAPIVFGELLARLRAGARAGLVLKICCDRLRSTSRLAPDKNTSPPAWARTGLP